jgi:tetratricopeptide (TPR) repeat protein
LEREKELIAGWVGQVQMLIALDEYSEAELWSRKALELFKNNPDLLAGRAHALCRLGDLKNAQTSADAAIAQQGLHSYPWVARGELMLARREALDDYCFDKAMQIDTDWLIPLEIGAIYLHFDRATKALQRTRIALEKAPGHAYCWYCQGVCEQELGLTSASGKSFRRCLELAPKYEPARQRIREQDRRGVRGFFRKLLHRA